MSPVIDLIGSAKGFGWGAFSIPILPGMSPIATFTATGAESTIEFAGIPSGYTDLQIRIFGKNTATNESTSSAIMNFNNDTNTSYAWSYMSAWGSYNTGSATTQNALALLGGSLNSSTAQIAMYAGMIVDIYNYASSTNKTIRYVSGSDSNNTSSSSRIVQGSGLWNSTSTINNIKIQVGNGSNWANDSIITLYGIKAFL